MGANKELLLRIKGVKATQKITKAMKMVAASKLKKFRLKLQSAMPYYDNLEHLLSNLTLDVSNLESKLSPLLSITPEKANSHLIIVANSNRGLCGAFNSNIIKFAKKTINELLAQGKEVKIFCIGKKGYEQLKADYAEIVIEKMEIHSKNGTSFKDAEEVATKIISLLDQQQFGVCSIIYNIFKSTISQKLTYQQLIPFQSENENPQQYQSEPSNEKLLAELLPHNLAIQIYHALIENETSEQGSRMSSMENASKNAGEMIQDLTLRYNSSRQASITKELIEIISGSEAL